MEFFTCSVCRVTQPKSLDAFGLPGATVCQTCYEKDSKEDNQSNSQRHIQTGVEADKDSLPK